MPIYEWKCPVCEVIAAETQDIHHGPSYKLGCPRCGQMMNRRYTVPAVPIGFEPHFNDSVGAYVKSKKDYEDKVKASDEAMSKRLGSDQTSLIVDHREIPNVTGEGTEARSKMRRDAGVDESKKTIIT